MLPIDGGLQRGSGLPAAEIAEDAARARYWADLRERYQHDKPVFQAMIELLLGGDGFDGEVLAAEQRRRGSGLGLIEQRLFNGTGPPRAAATG